MRMIYICSPYRGNEKANIDRACRYCRYALLSGFLPIAPHLYFTSFLDDAIPSERKMGIYLGIQLLKKCHEVWVFGVPTEGMRKEIEQAQLTGVPVRFFDAEGRALE